MEVIFGFSAQYASGKLSLWKQGVVAMLALRWVGVGCFVLAVLVVVSATPFNDITIGAAFLCVVFGFILLGFDRALRLLEKINANLDRTPPSE